MSTECLLDSRWKACCCTCVYHIEDFHHCRVSPELRKDKDECICGDHRGWICMPPEFNGAHSGWSEHGMCELHTPRVVV